jgi:hypothetical protein
MVSQALQLEPRTAFHPMYGSTAAQSRGTQRSNKGQQWRRTQYTRGVWCHKAIVVLCAMLCWCQWVRCRVGGQGFQGWLEARTPRQKMARAYAKISNRKYRKAIDNLAHSSGNRPHNTNTASLHLHRRQNEDAVEGYSSRAHEPGVSGHCLVPDVCLHR